MSLELQFMLYEMERQDRLEALHEGLVAWVRAYYEEYTDAEEIEAPTLAALRTAYEALFNLGGGELVESAVRTAEHKINAAGGQKSDSDGTRHTVKTWDCYEYEALDRPQPKASV